MERVLDWPTSVTNLQTYNFSTFSPTGIDIATQYGLAIDNDRGYYFEQDPVVNVFDTSDTDVELDLELNINTNQHGRTFEDRTHVFAVKERPADVPASATIRNLNVSLAGGCCKGN